ncbi:MAG: SGNH/GDSL hydrolase family protein [Muribaculaceae bacterium]|nr:SGNH/GDSL hydrolase family protein [Muribaculaceae bacterium]
MLGRGRLSYCGYWLEITDDELKVWSYLYYDNEVQTLRHGLDIHDDLFVSIDYDYGPTATVTMTSGDKTKTLDAKWWGGGAVFAQNLTQDTINVELSFFPKGVGYSVWLIGDSYMNWSNATRWLYYLKEAGYNNWMADHIPGGGSGLMIASFKNTLKYGCPKYAVWAIGMNDRSDYATEPYPYWLKNTKEFVAVCQKSGITPILCTTPCVPGRDHKRKNEWVRNSGLRYIDFARAVAIDDGPTWYDGYIATDSVHPTALGAAAIARRALIDFPELTNK